MYDMARDYKHKQEERDSVRDGEMKAGAYTRPLPIST